MPKYRDVKEPKSMYLNENNALRDPSPHIFLTPKSHGRDDAWQREIWRYRAVYREVFCKERGASSPSKADTGFCCIKHWLLGAKANREITKQKAFRDIPCDTDPPGDHWEWWMRWGRRAGFTIEPYGLDRNLLTEIFAWADRNNCDVKIGAHPSWHCFGSSTLVEVWVKDHE